MVGVLLRDESLDGGRTCSVVAVDDRFVSDEPHTADGRLMDELLERAVPITDRCADLVFMEDAGGDIADLYVGSLGDGLGLHKLGGRTRRSGGALRSRVESVIPPLVVGYE